MKWTCFLPIAALAAVASPARARDLVYFGTHGDQPGAELFGAWFDGDTGTLTPLGEVAQVFRPTWLASMTGQPVLFSVSEAGNDGKSEGRILAFRVDRATGKLTALGDVAAGGGGTTHLDYDPRSHSLFAANFGSGSVTVVPVAADGHLGPVAGKGQDEGHGPQPRQQGPHAHAVTVAPGGHFVVVPDLGADRTFVWRFDPQTRALTPGNPPFVPAEPGTGPRHIVFGRDGRFAYEDTELTAKVVVYRWNGAKGTLAPIQSLDVMPATTPGQRSAGEIAVSADGRFLYVSDREGENAIAVYAIDRASGRLHEVQHVQAGDRPWSFTLAPGGRWMLIAEEGAGKVAVWARDPASGKIRATGHDLAVPRPVNATFIPSTETKTHD